MKELDSWYSLKSKLNIYSFVKFKESSNSALENALKKLIEEKYFIAKFKPETDTYISVSYLLA